MKRLLLSTALVAALMGSGVGVNAQTTATMPTVTVPEGYARQDTALTAEQLLGASIYDANGDAVGEVEDLVFDAATGAAAGAATAVKPAATVDSTGAMSTDGTVTDGTATDSTVTGTGTEGTTGTDTTGKAATGTEAGSDAAGTAATGSDTTGTAPATDMEGAADTTAATETTGTANTTAAPDATETGTATTMTDSAAKITHAVLDVGGFLGIGEHRIAVPMEDLVLYTKGTDVRVYLGWTKEQLEAQASYDPNDANTLGRSTMAPAN